MQSRLEVAVVPRRGSALADQTCARQLVQDALARIAEQNVHAAFLQILRSLLQGLDTRSEEHTSELQSLMRSSYAVFCLKKKNITKQILNNKQHKHQNQITS